MMFASETARYAWIDLSAGPLTYGPETAGEGIVTWFSIPRVDMVGLRAGSCAREWNEEMAIWGWRKPGFLSCLLPDNEV